MERVIYKKNPLAEVIIQYRFPQILALNTNDPIDFQDAIKEDYPLYRLDIENQQEVSFAINQENAIPPIPTIIQKPIVKNHSFISADGMHKINLTNSFISISTLGYTRWEEMLSRFTKPLTKFEEIYLPPFYERIGLRYIDVFSRQNLGLEGTPWKELINPFYIGAFQNIDEDSILSAGLNVEYYLDNKKSIAKIHTGIGTANNNPEQVFILDSDFVHIDNIKRTACAEVLDYLHTNAKNVIGYAVTEKLHLAMEPEIVQ